MGNQRRRGKSVVFDSLPSFVTTEEDSYSLSRNSSRFSDKMSREALREIIMVLVGLALVVWLFFGQSAGEPPAEQLRMGSRQVLQSDSMYILPAHFGGSSARDGVKKAPGDKQGLKTLETTANKRTSGAIYQYDGRDAPKLVLVTVIDDNKHPRDYIDKIVENRLEYAQQHRFGVLIKLASEFAKFTDESYNHHLGWSRVALALEAQVSFPGAEWFWYLADDALIMQPERDPMGELLAEDRLEQYLLRQVSVMHHTNTHIKTYRNNRVQDISYVFCHDERGINTDSFFFKNNVASRVLLQLWSEPLYRSFQRFQDEEDALGHLMQWHTQFLVRTGVVGARHMGSLVPLAGADEGARSDQAYVPGDFVAVVDCDYTAESCKRDFQKKWNERKRLAPAGKAGGAGAAVAAKDTVQNQVQVQAQEKAQVKAEAKVAEDAQAEAGKKLNM